MSGVLWFVGGALLFLLLLIARTSRMITRRAFHLAAMVIDLIVATGLVAIATASVWPSLGA